MNFVPGGPPLPPGIGVPPIPNDLSNSSAGTSIPPPPSPVFNPQDSPAPQSPSPQ